jgi:hypothetical protein
MTIMAYRDRAVRRATPLLQPNEQLQHIFPAEAGAHPILARGFGLLGWLLFAEPRVIAVTDQAVVVFKANLNGTQPKEVLARLPLGSLQGQPSGLWGKVQVDGKRMYVHRKFHKEVNAALAGTATAA